MGEFAIPAVSQSTPPQLTGHRVWWNRFSGFEGAYQSSYSSVKTGTFLQQWNPQPISRGIAEEIRHHQINISHRHYFVVRPWNLLSKKQAGWILDFLNSVMKTADLHVPLARCFVTHLKDSVVNPDLFNLELSIKKCCTKNQLSNFQDKLLCKFYNLSHPFLHTCSLQDLGLESNPYGEPSTRNQDVFAIRCSARDPTFSK